MDSRINLTCDWLAKFAPIGNRLAVASGKTVLASLGVDCHADGCVLHDDCRRLPPMNTPAHKPIPSSSCWMGYEKFLYDHQSRQLPRLIACEYCRHERYVIRNKVIDYPLVYILLHFVSLCKLL